MAKQKSGNLIRSLTGRWLFQTTTIIIAVLLLICVAAAYFIHSLYYNSVERKIESNASTVDMYFDKYTTDDKSFELGAKEFISDFPEKNQMEVWVINKYGEVIISSSGFAVEEKIKFIDTDQSSDTKSENNYIDEDNRVIVPLTTGNMWIGNSTNNNEHIIRYTKEVLNSDGEFMGAVCYTVSLTTVDAQIMTWYLIIVAAFLVLVLLLSISGMLFISSIVKPIREINDTAKMIADGNYDVRIDHYLYKDEIGDLCDTINSMAVKIKSSDKIRNDFISTVSHELRTPLTAIKGWGETLLQIGDTDPNLTKRGMGVIINESTRLNGIVEELLDFSRIQSGRMTLKNEKMDVLAELDETVFAFKDRSMREGIELLYNAPNLPAPMDGDPDRIKQVFVNILDNALKYTKQGGKITVTADVRNDKIYITVADTGCGISPEDLPHVKEKFYKTNLTVHGSGIGLAVVDEIIRLHHGIFDIDSVLGMGTTVKIKFDIDHVELEDVWDIDAAIAEENEKIAKEENDNV